MPNHTDAMNRIFATAEALKRAGEVFQIGRILTGTAKGTCLYPAGNEFAKKTCKVVFK